MNIWIDMSVFLLDLIVKATVLMAATFLVVKIFGKDRANWRSLMLNLCVVGLLLIPIASVMMPELQVSFYPRLETLPQSQSVISFDGVSEEFEMHPVESHHSEGQEIYDSEAQDVPVVGAPLAAVGPLNSKTGPGETSVPIRETYMPNLGLFSSVEQVSLSLPQLLVGLYLLGFGWMLLRLCVQGIRGRLFLQSLRPCQDKHLVARLADLRQQLHVRRPVRLVHGEHIQSPTLFGVFHPTIVFPADMSEIEDVDSVLVHELIHVRRFDCLFRVLSEAMRAVYWFHPLAWIVKRSLSEVQEHACDDWTIATVGNSHAYATLLLAVATRFQKQTPVVVGMEMARRPQVFTRVERILDLGERVIPLIGKRTLMTSAVAFVAGVLLLGSVTASIVQQMKFEGGEVVVEPKEETMDGPFVAQDGSLWWRNPGVVLRQVGDEWTRFDVADGVMNGRIGSMLQARDGSLWFGGDHNGLAAVNHFDGKSWKMYTHRDGLLSTSVILRSEDRDGHIWANVLSAFHQGAKRGNPVLGGYGAFCFDGTTWVRYTIENGLSHNRVYDIKAHPDGSVWVATLGGLNRFDGDSWRVFAVKDGLFANKVYQMQVAKDGKVWATHGSSRSGWIDDARGGVSVFDGQTWQVHTPATGMPIGAVRSVMASSDGALWFGTHRDDSQATTSGGWLRYQDRMWLRLLKEDGLPGKYVYDAVKHGDVFHVAISTDRFVPYQPPLDQLATLTGRVTHQQDGQPRVGVGIRVEDRQGRTRAGTMTGQDGHYRVQVLPGEYRVYLVPVNSALPVVVQAEEGGRVENVNLVIHKSHTVTGQVTDVRGAPISGASIIASSGIEDKGFLPQHLKTDENGKYELRLVNPKMVRIQVAAPGYAWATAHAYAGETVNVALKKGLTIKGQIVDQNGEPVSYAWVEWGMPKSRSNRFIYPKFHNHGRTDAQGRFVLPDVVREEGKLLIQHYACQDTTLNVHAREEQRLEVYRIPKFSVSGRVMRHGEPASGQLVKYWKYRKIDGDSWSLTSGGNTVIDGEGKYLVEDLEPGSYRFMLYEQNEWLPSLARRKQASVVRSKAVDIVDSNVQADINPVGRLKLSGRVFLNSRPASGVHVTAHLNEGEGLAVDFAKTDVNGYYELAELPAERIRLGIEHQVWGRDKMKHRWATEADTVDMRKNVNMTKDLYLKQEDQRMFTTERAGLSDGYPAPNFEAQRLDGSTFRLSDTLKDKVVLVDFWATWCGPYVKELPNLKAAYEKYRKMGVEIVGVSMDQDRKVLTDFVKREKLVYPQIFDVEKTKAIAKAYQVWGIPATFLIDQNGKIRASNLRGEKLDEAVQMLLRTKGG